MATPASTALTAQSRTTALEKMAAQPLDILVVGGGVTGAGIALDAATRGLRTGVVEARDWAGGTSQWSSKLVHGGLRYLYQLNFPLVAEALGERAMLINRIAPHLVKAQPFLWPLKMPVIERAYSAVGVGMYDGLAQIRSHGDRGVPMQKHYSRKGALRLFPGIKEDALVGAIRFYDARVDDARLVIDLVRTAVGHGALAATRSEVVGYLREGDQIVGATVKDIETGATFEVKARHIINATGVWTEQTQDLATEDGGLHVLASKGVHIVVPKDHIDGETGLFLRTEKSVLFIIPWDRYWVIGTTDTPWKEDVAKPVATTEDIDYILEHANSVLAKPLTREDIIGTYAGLRPLLQPKKSDGGSTKVSREHTVSEVAPGLSSIAGGKLTTYRVMAQDAVDFALEQSWGHREAQNRPSITNRVPLVGAADYPAWQARVEQVADEYGISPVHVQHLLDRYGDEIGQVLAPTKEDPSLAQPLEHAPAYLRAEVVFGVTHEGALHLEDVLRARTRLDYETRDRGISALAEVADLMAPLLGWSAADVEKEKEFCVDRAEGMIAAEQQDTDAEAVAAFASKYDETVPA
ncbi:glycerol-3-phosphate dehydrogenase/oxidase [Dermacoccaceae bacterium W4C1]